MNNIFDCSHSYCDRPCLKVGYCIRRKEGKMYCRQCMGICNDPKKCQIESCELRLKETGDLRKKDKICLDCGGKWERMEDYEAHRCYRDRYGPMIRIEEYAEKANRSPGYVAYDKEKRMTRQEAIEKIKGVCVAGSNEWLVDSLAALGLVSFEVDEKGNAIANQIGFTYSYLVRAFRSDLTAVGQAFIDDLTKAGYRIVRNKS